jgi:hypothetical protein
MPLISAVSILFGFGARRAILAHAPHQRVTSGWEASTENVALQHLPVFADTMFDSSILIHSIVAGGLLVMS